MYHAFHQNILFISSAGFCYISGLFPKFKNILTGLRSTCFSLLHCSGTAPEGLDWPGLGGAEAGARSQRPGAGLPGGGRVPARSQPAPLGVSLAGKTDSGVELCTESRHLAAQTDSWHLNVITEDNLLPYKGKHKHYNIK